LAWRADAAAADVARLASATQSVGRPKQGCLVSLAGRHLSDDFAPEHNDHTVANQANLRQFGREQEHGRAGIGQLSQEPIDLMLGADIDAASRIEAKQGLKARGDPSRNDHLLLIAAAEPPEFRPGAGVNLQPLDGGANARPLASAANEPPIPRVADERQRDILADRALRQEGLKPIRRDQHEAGCNRVTGMVELQLSAACQDLSAIMAAHARDAIEELLLALPLERCDA